MNELSVEKIKEWRKQFDDRVLIHARKSGLTTTRTAIEHVDFLLSHIEEIERDTARRCVEIARGESVDPCGPITASYNKSIRDIVRVIEREFNLGGE